MQNLYWIQYIDFLDNWQLKGSYSISFSYDLKNNAVWIIWRIGNESSTYILIMITKNCCCWLGFCCFAQIYCWSRVCRHNCMLVANILNLFVGADTNFAEVLLKMCKFIGKSKILLGYNKICNSNVELLRLGSDCDGK